MSSCWRGVERIVMDAEQELEALWSAVFGEPPFIRAEADMLTQVMVDALPLAPPYVVGGGGPMSGSQGEVS